MLYCDQTKVYSSKGKNETAKTFYNDSESLCERVLEILQEISNYQSILRF